MFRLMPAILMVVVIEYQIQFLQWCIVRSNEGQVVIKM
jgi:hypothetical protein